MTKAIDQKGEEHEVPSSLYTHTRGGRADTKPAHLTVTVDVKLTAEQVSDCFYNLSSAEQAEFFRQLFEHWICVGQHMTQDIQRIGEHLAGDERQWGLQMIAALYEYSGAETCSKSPTMARSTSVPTK